MNIHLKKFIQKEEGATMVEYSILAGIIAGAALAAFEDIRKAIFMPFMPIWEALWSLSGG